MTSSRLEEKRALLERLLERKKGEAPASAPAADRARVDELSYDMFMTSMGERVVEAERFSDWMQAALDQGLYPFESPRLHGQRAEVTIEREGGERLKVLNFSSYDYLGLSRHPQVLEAAHHALDRYGLGAASSPAISGTFDLHRKLEGQLAQAYAAAAGRPRSASLFSSGYGVNLGVVSAVIKPGNHVILDQEAHMSLIEGAKLSGGRIHYFRHNDPDHLDRVLAPLRDGHARSLVCVEGVYSASGELGRISELAKVARRHGAQLLVDEAHSALLAGPQGLGVTAAQGVLGEVDYLVLTFSKAFGGVGGAVIAAPELVRYINWYARCRFFSCALDPAVTGGLSKGLEIALSAEGDARRARLLRNASHLRRRLSGPFAVEPGDSWVIPVVFGSEKLTLKLNDWLQRQGLDTSIMAFPATPKNEARVRLFVTSEHTLEQCDHAADILAKAGERFGFGEGARPQGADDDARA